MSGPKETLRELEKARPGERFQRLYRKRQQGRHARWLNAAFNVGGIAVVAAGVLTYPIPVVGVAALSYWAYRAIAG